MQCLSHRQPGRVETTSVQALRRSPIAGAQRVQTMLFGSLEKAKHFSAG
jgi:hypothetical protein